jgi:hypothetical protein
MGGFRNPKIYIILRRSFLTPEKSYFPAHPPMDDNVITVQSQSERLTVQYPFLDMALY